MNMAFWLDKFPGLLVILSIGAAAACVRYYLDRRAWNGGVSPSGQPWRYFDTASDGSRGYSDEAGNVCWILSPRVDIRIYPM